MRKLTAISFLLVLLFNLYGYQLVIAYFQKEVTTSLAAQLDGEQYSDAELVTLKVPAVLPYYTSSDKYERVKGSIEMDGIEYQYVKRRIYNDTLELLCIPNHAKQKLENAKDAFFMLCNDWQNTQPHKKSTTPNILKSVLPDYCEDLYAYTIVRFEAVRETNFISIFDPLPQAYLLQLEKPPEGNA